MTFSTDVRPHQDNSVAQTSTGRADVFYDLLITLTEDAGLALDAPAIRAFRRVIDLTIGDYLATASRTTREDLWQDERFQKWAKINMRKIARVALEMGGTRPSAEVIRLACNQVILDTHDEYCATLPRSTPVTRGPVCEHYIALLNSTEGGAVG